MHPGASCMLSDQWLPVLAAWVALERADQLGRDPAAIKAAGLRADGRTVDGAIEGRRIERHTVCQRLGAGKRPWVAPRHIRQTTIAMH